MPKLTETNPYLHDPAKRAAMIRQSVASSSAVEGIHAPFKVKGTRKSSSIRKDAKRTIRATK
jgi:hypothetical protein